MPTRRSFSANVALNSSAMVVPAITAAIVLPRLLASLGAERLGLLTLAWSAIGSFALLDLGIGRAMTQETAARLATGRRDDVAAIVAPGLVLLTIAGTVGGLALGVAAGAITRALVGSGGLEADVRRAVVVVALSLPFVTLASGLRGVLEGFGRFGPSAAVRMGIGVITYLGPLLVGLATTSLAMAIATIAVARVVAALAMLMMVAGLVDLRPFRRDGRGQLRTLLRGGAWITLASVCGAWLALVDRPILGVVLSIATVTYYATPQELIGRLTIVPMALSGVIFPAMSAAAAGPSPQVRALFTRGLGWTFALLFPIVAALAALAPEWLTLWLGHEFSRESYGAAQWFCLSVLYQSLAVTPLNLLQAAGWARASAVVQVVQLPLFVIAIWAGARVAGLEGAACVWAVRTLVDLAAHLWLARRAAPAVATVVRDWMLPLAMTTAWFGAVMAITPWPPRAVLLAVALGTTAACLPRVLGADDFALLRHRVATWFGINRPAVGR